MLDRGCKEADGCSGHDPSNTMSERWELVGVGFTVSVKRDQGVYRWVRIGVVKQQSTVEGQGAKHTIVNQSLGFISYFKIDTQTHTESITIHPTSGGVAPLYNPVGPSLRIVCSTQSNGPLKWPSLLVCSRTLTVSNLSLVNTAALQR